MKNILILPALLLSVLSWISCSRPVPTEAQEAAFWEPRVIAPARKLLFDRENLPAALSRFDSLSEGTGRHSVYAKTARYIMQADYHRFLTKKLDSTLFFLDSALQLYSHPAVQKQFPKACVGLYVFCGEMSFQLGYIERCNQYFSLAQDLAGQYLSPCESSSFTYIIAMVLYHQQNYAQSAAYFRKAYASQNSCAEQTTANVLRQQEVLSNIGLCLVNMEKYDSAIAYYQRALNLATLHADSLGAKTVDMINGVVAGNQANIYLKKGELAEAEKLFRQSIALNSRPGYDNNDALLAQVQLAGVFGRQNRFVEMNETLQKARKGLDTIANQDAETKWRLLMANFYGSQNKTEQELKYYKAYNALRDSVTRQQSKIARSDVSRQLHDREQGLQIELLQKTNQFNNHLIAIAVVIILLTGLIIYLVNQKYRKRKQHILALTKLNAEISEQKEALEKAGLEKDRILNVVAHDLRNPISLVSYVSARLQAEDLQESEQRSVKMIREASAQALALTNGLLDSFHRNEDAETDTIDFAALVQNSIDQHQFRAAEKGQQLIFRSEADTTWVAGARLQLARVVDNLLSNAVKFAPLETPITLSLERKQHRLSLEVTNEGESIPPEWQEKIFERFTTVRKKGTKGEKSFGLGLSIARELAALHGGSLTVKNTGSQNTTFVLALPLLDDLQFFP